MAEPMAMTVLGPVPAHRLGFIQPHEHVFFDAAWPKHRWDLPVLEDRAQMTEEVALYAEAGGQTIVDVTPKNVGRNPEGLRSASEATGVHLVMGTGWYREPLFPESINRTPTSVLADLLIEEIQHGVDETGIRPGIIGEVGSDRRWITAVEERAFRAAARAHRATGLALTIHTPPHTAIRIHELLVEEQVNPARVIYGHTDNTLELEYLEAILATGGYVQFDTIGVGTINSDSRRASVLIELIRRGYLERLLISLDVTTRDRLRTNGGHGYGHIIESFLPRLRAGGVSGDEIKVITELNPQRLLSI